MSQSFKKKKIKKCIKFYRLPYSINTWYNTITTPNQVKKLQYIILNNSSSTVHANDKIKNQMRP